MFVKPAGYLGAEMFIMRQVDGRETVGVVGPALDAYNKRHAGKRIAVEWGIGGLKMKWKILRGTFSMRRWKFSNVFRCCCILTNFIHRRRKNYGIDDLGDVPGGAWDGDDLDQN